MISREHSYQMSKSTLNIPVGLLIRSPKKRLEKLGRNSSNGSVQSKLSSATTRSAESALHRESKKNKAHWHSQGLAAIFSRGAHLDGAGGDGAALSDTLSEMSGPDSSPSILKIFGSAVSQGAHYKSVLATMHSTAKEIIKEALERYGLEDDADAYVLCEVVGCKGEDLQWRSECSRVVGALERPLLLQAMWRPAEGFSRRFEIQRRATLEQSGHTGKQAATLGSGRQPKNGSRVTSMLMELGVKSPELWRSLSELELPPTSENSPHANEVQGPSREREETESNGDCGTQLFSSPQISCTIPQTPCFLLLQGYSSSQDCVIYPLDGTTTAFGRSQGGEPVFGVALQLHAPDILPLHCRVLRQEAQRDGASAAVLLEPLHGAPVTLNGTALTQQAQLCHWDLVGFGNHYLFLYKDPTTDPAHKMPPWLTSGHQRAPVCPTCGCSPPRTSWGPSLRLKDPKCRDLSLSYELEHKDRILEEIFAVVDPRGDDPKLTPAFLLCLCIQHSAVNFRASDFHRLLLQIAGRVQTAVGDMTKELASVQPETPSGGGQSDLGESQSVPIPDIRPLVLWMANSLELLHFIQQEVPRLLPWAEEEEEEEVEEDDPGSPRSPWQQAIAVLEEVVMFTFQQSVYHLTKSLYSTLFGLLDSSPFSENGQLQTPKAVLDTVAVFRDAMRTFSTCGVHRDIATQLFAYLFFFTNASIFNTLMERGATDGFYQWSRGVQIRANLDLLMDWIQGAGLADVADGFFQKLSSAVNLLATPRETLLQASWSSLRSDFEPLSPAQLHHVLQQYHSGRACPAAWSPAPQDAVAAWSGADVLESFDGHPPLVLPRSGFQLQLGQPVPDAGLVARLQSLQDLVCSLALPSVHPEQKPCSEASSPAAMKNSTGTAPYNGPLLESQVGEAAVLSQCPTAARCTSVGNLSSCQTVLTQKLRSLELQCTLRKQPDLSCHRGLALDPSCLLTPPNTPQGHELAEPDASLQGCAPEREAVDQQRQRENQSPCCKNKEDYAMDEEVFSVELQMGPQGLGLALVDGMSSPMKMSGIYIRSVVPDSPAAWCCRLGPGDRILAVNGQSLVGMEYHSGKELMQTSGDKLSLLVAKCVWKV